MVSLKLFQFKIINPMKGMPLQMIVVAHSHKDAEAIIDKLWGNHWAAFNPLEWEVFECEIKNGQHFFVNQPTA